MMRVVFLDRASLKAKLRKFAFPAEYVEHQKTAAGEIVARLQGADIAIVNKVPMRAETLRQLPQLRMIAVAATGYDVVDIPYCNQHGIAVANIRNYAVHTVPEHAFAMILALRNRHHKRQQSQHDQQYSRNGKGLHKVLQSDNRRALRVQHDNCTRTRATASYHQPQSLKIEPSSQSRVEPLLFERTFRAISRIFMECCEGSRNL